MKYIDNPARMQKEIIKRSYLIGAIPLIYSLIGGYLRTFRGLLLGLLISTLILRLKVIHIRRALKMSEERANTFIRNRYFIEFAIYFIVLIVARKNESLNFLAAAGGLFLIKFTVIGWMVIDLIRRNWQKRMDRYK